MDSSNEVGRLDARSYTRTYREEVEIVLSGLDCALNGEKAGYASSDLTTGQRFYRLLRERGARDRDDLRGKLGEDGYRAELFAPNAAAACEFARRLRGRLGGATLVITPAPLVAPGWSQAEYLAFFETLIRTRVASVFFNDGWQYSNGCTFELAIALDAGIPTFDADHRPLDAARGLVLLEEATRELESAGIEPVGLEQHQGLIQRLAERKPRSSPGT